MRFLSLTLVLALVACGQPTPMLHEMEGHAGLVEFYGPVGGSFTGHLAFERQSGNLQFQLRDPQGASLTRDGNGELKAYASGVWRPATEQESAMFELVVAAVEYRVDDGETPVPWEGGYTLDLQGRQLRVRMIPVSDPHQMR